MYVTPKGGTKRDFAIFSSKFQLLSKKSAAKFLRVKTSSGKVVATSFLYLTAHRQIAGDVPIYLNFALKKVKVKVVFLYSATYTVNHRDQPRFTISEVAVDWQEPMVLQRKLRPSIARVNVQLDPRHAASKQTTAPINHTRPSPHKLSPDGAARPSEETHIRLQLTTHFIDLERKNGGVDLVGWLHTEIKCRLRELNPYTSPIPVLTGLDVE